MLLSVSGNDTCKYVIPTSKLVILFLTFNLVIMEKAKPHTSTICTHLGRGTKANSGFVNPAVERGSTYLFPDLDSLHASNTARLDPGRVAYGRHGTHTSRQLELMVAELEGGYAARATTSGLTAITTALMSFVQSGDHILVVDSAFDPTRHFCDTTLKRFNVEVTYYDALETDKLENRIKSNTRLIFLESPGSLTFEVQDIPAIVTIARKHDLITLMDNTWATPLLFPAIKYGINISIHAATKYISGHSDVILGLIITDEQHWPRLLNGYSEIGQSCGSEEIALTLRGIRSLPLRLQRHGASALTLALWLQDQSEVEKVFHPALKDCPGHEIWKRDFNGAAGLFSILLTPQASDQLPLLIKSLNYFGLGVSWGGYESLLLPVDPRTCRSAKPWRNNSSLLRISVGLEDVNDLIADFEQAFYTMRTSQT